MFSKDFKELLSIFAEKKVKYLVVGGYAVSFYAQPRATKDLDLFIGADSGNAKAVYLALAEFGAPLAGIGERDFLEPGKFFRMGQAPEMVELLPAIDGVAFEDAWERRVQTTIDAESGMEALFISLEDLIAAKLAAGRPQDIADVAALRRAAKVAQPSSKRN